MKISRRGTSADHGQSEVKFVSPKISWLKSDSCIAIEQSNIKDFSTKAHHSYKVRITVAELNAILKSLAAAAIAEPSMFEKNFEPSLKAIMQLQSVVAGVRT